MKIRAVSLTLATLTTLSSFSSINQMQLVAGARTLGRSIATEFVNLGVVVLKSPSTFDQDRFSKYCMSQALEGFKIQLNNTHILKKFSLDRQQLHDFKVGLAQVKNFILKEARKKIPFITMPRATLEQKKIGYHFYTFGKKSAQFLIVLEAYSLTHKVSQSAARAFEKEIALSFYAAVEDQLKSLDSAAIAKKEGITQEQEKQLHALIELLRDMLCANLKETMSINISSTSKKQEN